MLTEQLKRGDRYQMMFVSLKFTGYFLLIQNMKSYSVNLYAIQIFQDLKALLTKSSYFSTMKYQNLGNLDFSFICSIFV